jgi:tRNA G18 (ribose-2'-O)-methylase SpoU
MDKNGSSIKELRDSQLVESNSSYNVHDHLKHLGIDDLVILSQQDRLPWHTMCLNVTGDLNVGTMIRTSHCMGAESVLIFGRQKLDNRSLVGAANYIRVEKIKTDVTSMDPVEFVDALASRHMVPVFVESNGYPLPSIDWKLRIKEMERRNTQPCLVMGNETGGIPQDLLDTERLFPNSFRVSIPQRGVIRSLNVAVAHATVASAMCMAMGWM